MASKKLKIGSLLRNTRKFNNNGQEVEKTLVSIGLGNVKNKDPKYNLHVELIVTDSAGKVVHRQKDGFINLVDPGTQPDELLAAGVIDEEAHHQMKERLKNLPDSIRYNLELNLKG
jgi:hypothetical protein